MITCVRIHGPKEDIISICKSFIGYSFVWKENWETDSIYKHRLEMVQETMRPSLFAWAEIANRFKGLPQKIPDEKLVDPKAFRGLSSGDEWCLANIGPTKDFELDTLQRHTHFINDVCKHEAEHSIFRPVKRNSRLGKNFLGFEENINEESVFFGFETKHRSPLILFEHLSLKWDKCTFTIKASNLIDTLDIIKFDNGDVLNIRIIEGRDTNAKAIIEYLFRGIATMSPAFGRAMAGVDKKNNVLRGHILAIRSVFEKDGRTK